MSERARPSQELQAAREGRGRGWGGGRGRPRLTIQSGLPVGSHSQEGLGEEPGQMQRKKKKEKSVSCGLESRPPPRHRPRPRPVPPQTARKQTYFLPPAGPPAPPAAPGPRHSRRGLLSRDPGATARCRPRPGCRRSGPCGRPAGEGGDASGFPPAARRRRHFSSQRRRWPCWPWSCDRRRRAPRVKVQDGGAAGPGSGNSCCCGAPVAAGWARPRVPPTPGRTCWPRSSGRALPSRSTPLPARGPARRARSGAARCAW